MTWRTDTGNLQNAAATRGYHCLGQIAVYQIPELPLERRVGCAKQRMTDEGRNIVQKIFLEQAAKEGCQSLVRSAQLILHACVARQIVQSEQ